VTTETALKRPPKDAPVEEQRAWRREYQKLYRSGAIQTRKPEIAHDSSPESPPNKTRRRISYYLDPGLVEAMREFMSENELMRREVTEMALERFFGHQRAKRELKASDVPFTDKKFLHDKISGHLWLLLDEFCRDRQYNRKLRTSQVVEQAIRELVAPGEEYAHGTIGRNADSGRIQPARGRPRRE
jgi:hypothetical protein